MTSPALQQADAEACVLGAVLLEPERLAVVRPLLPSPAAFTDRGRAVVYAAILAVYDTGQPLDFVTLGAEIRRQAGQEHAAEVQMAELLDMAVTAQNVEAHARLVLDAWRRRQAITEADRLRKAAADPTIPLTDAVADTCQRLVPIGTGNASDPPRSLVSVFLDTLEDLERRTAQAQAVLGLTTGFDALDALTDGWQAGTLTILAARPSRGKTALALAMARHTATLAPVDFVSIEMTEDQIVARLLQAEVGRDLRHLRRDADLFARYAPALSRASADLSRLPLAIDCRSRSPARVRLEQQALAAQRGQPTGLLVIDYLGLMQADQPQQNRDRELGAITGALKAMARELRLPVLLLCQLNRSSDRENRAPELWDLRDSGNIEQDADDVLMLHWPEGKPERGPATVDLHARKVRNGHTGTVPLVFEPWTQRWSAAGERSTYPHEEHVA